MGAGRGGLKRDGAYANVQMMVVSGTAAFAVLLEAWP